MPQSPAKSQPPPRAHQRSATGARASPYITSGDRSPHAVGDIPASAAAAVEHPDPPRTAPVPPPKQPLPAASVDRSATLEKEEKRSDDLKGATDTGWRYAPTGSASGRAIYEGPMGRFFYLTIGGNKSFLPNINRCIAFLEKYRAGRLEPSSGSTPAMHGADKLPVAIPQAGTPAPENEKVVEESFYKTFQLADQIVALGLYSTSVAPDTTGAKGHDHGASAVAHITTDRGPHPGRPDAEEVTRSGRQHSTGVTSLTDTPQCSRSLRPNDSMDATAAYPSPPVMPTTGREARRRPSAPSAAASVSEEANKTTRPRDTGHADEPAGAVQTDYVLRTCEPPECCVIYRDRSSGKHFYVEPHQGQSRELPNIDFFLGYCDQHKDVIAESGALAGGQRDWQGAADAGAAVLAMRSSRVIPEQLLQWYVHEQQRGIAEGTGSSPYHHNYISPSVPSSVSSQRLTCNFDAGMHNAIPGFSTLSARGAGAGGSQPATARDGQQDTPTMTTPARPAPPLDRQRKGNPNPRSQSEYLQRMREGRSPRTPRGGSGDGGGGGGGLRAAPPTQEGPASPRPASRLDDSASAQPAEDEETHEERLLRRSRSHLSPSFPGANPSNSIAEAMRHEGPGEAKSGTIATATTATTGTTTTAAGAGGTGAGGASAGLSRSSSAVLALEALTAGNISSVLPSRIACNASASPFADSGSIGPHGSTSRMPPLPRVQSLRQPPALPRSQPLQPPLSLSTDSALFTEDAASISGRQPFGSQSPMSLSSRTPRRLRGVSGGAGGGPSLAPTPATAAAAAAAAAAVAAAAAAEEEEAMAAAAQRSASPGSAFADSPPAGRPPRAPPSPRTLSSHACEDAPTAAEGAFALSPPPSAAGAVATNGPTSHPPPVSTSAPNQQVLLRSLTTRTGSQPALPSTSEPQPRRPQSVETRLRQAPRDPKEHVLPQAQTLELHQQQQRHEQQQQPVDVNAMAAAAPPPSRVPSLPINRTDSGNQPNQYNQQQRAHHQQQHHHQQQRPPQQHQQRRIDKDTISATAYPLFSQQYPIGLKGMLQNTSSPHINVQTYVASTTPGDVNDHSDSAGWSMNSGKGHAGPVTVFLPTTPASAFGNMPYASSDVWNGYLDYSRPQPPPAPQQPPYLPPVGTNPSYHARRQANYAAHLTLKQPFRAYDAAVVDNAAPLGQGTPSPVVSAAAAAAAGIAPREGAVGGSLDQAALLRKMGSRDRGPPLPSPPSPTAQGQRPAHTPAAVHTVAGAPARDVAAAAALPGRPPHQEEQARAEDNALFVEVTENSNVDEEM